MTVKQFIKILKKYGEDKEVLFYSEDNSCWTKDCLITKNSLLIDDDTKELVSNCIGIDSNTFGFLGDDKEDAYINGVFHDKKNT